jgi:predicted PurR-regulated permease PerM
VDNFIKPLLISRTSSMSLFMVVLGVFGGVLAFGFMGIFIGPIFLVLTDSLARRWLDRYTAQQSS